jgi:hypothetical protein
MSARPAMQALVLEQVQRSVVVEQIKRCTRKNCEILITLRDHSSILGGAPVIVGAEEIQFCSPETRLPVVLRLDKISSIGASAE